MKILITGGTGYIGSHTCVQLIEKGWHPVILDSLVNSKVSVLDRIEQITGHRPPFIKADVREVDVVSTVLNDHAIDAVIHFAGLKSVGDSVEQPLRYYDNNVRGSKLLFEAMQKCGVKTLVFSSSATVYGNSSAPPWNEQVPTSPANPYGRSKLLVDRFMADVAAADSSCSLTSLRYFNPVGAHPSGLMGEDPLGTPNNLMPFLAQVAVGRRDTLQIFGNNYPTSDGTGVRDYLHVMDLAKGHIAALIYAHGRAGHHVFNLGSGQGHSVMAMLKAFGKACGKELPCQFAPPRSGDLAAYWADPQLARNTLAWQAEKTIDDMCQDTWRWQSENPNGYP